MQISGRQLGPTMHATNVSSLWPLFARDWKHALERDGILRIYGGTAGVSTPTLLSSCRPWVSVRYGTWTIRPYAVCAGHYPPFVAERNFGLGCVKHALEIRLSGFTLHVLLQPPPIRSPLARTMVCSTASTFTTAPTGTECGECLWGLTVYIVCNTPNR